jgi:hypothetical protein
LALAHDFVLPLASRLTAYEEQERITLEGLMEHMASLFLACFLGIKAWTCARQFIETRLRDPPILMPLYFWIAVVVFALSSGAFAAETVPLVIRLATMSQPNTPTIDSLVSFKRSVETITQSAIRVEIYDSGKLF